MIFAQTATTFDLSTIPGPIRSVGLFSLDDCPAYPEAPAYCPTPADMAWCLGYELEQMGERAMVRTIDGYTPEEHQAFANGQRQARADMTGKAPTPPVARLEPEDLASMLRVSAGWCEGQGGVLGEFLANLIRTAAGDVEYYRAGTWQEFSAREAEMIETLQRCTACENNAYFDRM
jgi:hypothetical protein